MNKKEKGSKAEEIACIFLKKRGFTIVDRNYSKRWGELDIVGIKDKVLHFFEVKSVSITSPRTHSYRPEDNVHDLKRRRLHKIVETYLAERGGGLGTQFYFHVICVYLNMGTRRARVKLIENVIL